MGVIMASRHQNLFPSTIAVPSLHIQWVFLLLSLANFSGLGCTTHESNARSDRGSISNLTKTPEGDWIGEVTKGDIPFRFAIHLSRVQEGWGGSMDAYSWRQNLPLKGV